MAESLSCGYGPIERLSAETAIRDALRMRKADALRAALRDCFVQGSSAAADSASAVLSQLKEADEARKVEDELRAVLPVVSDPNVVGIARLAVEYARNSSNSTLAVACLSGTRKSCSEIGRQLVEKLRLAYEVGEKEFLRTISKLEPCLTASLLPEETSPIVTTQCIVAVEVRQELFNLSPAIAMRLILPLLRRVGSDLIGDRSLLVRKLCENATSDNAAHIFAYGIDTGISQDDSKVALAALHSLPNSMLQELGLANVLFCCACLVLKCILEGEVETASSLVKVCLDLWGLASAENLDIVTVSLLYGVALTFAVSSGECSSPVGRERASTLASITRKTIDAARHDRWGLPDARAKEENVQELIHAVKRTAVNGDILSLLLCTLKTTRSKTHDSPRAFADWISGVGFKGTDNASIQTSFFEKVIAALFCGLLTWSPPIVCLSIFSSLESFGVASKSLFVPLILTALSTMENGTVAIEALRCVRSCADDKYSSQIALMPLRAMADFRTTSNMDQIKTGSISLADAAVMEISSFATEKPSLGFKLMLDCAEKMQVQWEARNAVPPTAAAMAAGILVMVRKRPSRGTFFVPLLQKCMQLKNKGPVQASLALRALRVLCDEEILEATKTLKIVFKSYKLSAETLNHLDPILSCGFIYFTGSASRATTSKKGRPMSLEITALLRSLVVAADVDLIIAETAAEALLAFDEKFALTHVEEALSEDAGEEVLAENASLVCHWMKQAMLRFNKPGTRSNLSALVIKYLGWEWSNRRRGEWSEMHVLKLVSKSLMKLSQGSKVSDRFKDIAASLPVSSVRVLSELAVELLNDSSAGVVAVDALCKTDSLVPGLPWAELFHTTLKNSTDISVRRCAARASFHLPIDLSKPVIASIFSTLQEEHDLVLDEVTAQILLSGTASFVGQLIEQYRKRARLPNMFNLVNEIKHDVKNPDGVIRLVELLLDPETEPLHEPELFTFVKILEVIPVDIYLRYVAKTKQRIDLLSLIVASEERKIPLERLLIPLIRRLLEQGDTVAAREDIWKVLRALQEIRSGNSSQLPELMVEVRDAARNFSEWGQAISQSTALACNHLLPFISTLEESLLL